MDQTVQEQIKSIWGWMAYQRTRRQVSKATLFLTWVTRFLDGKKAVGDSNICIEEKFNKGGYSYAYNDIRANLDSRIFKTLRYSNVYDPLLM
ncbi:unnamed protein product, partial [Sphenostylis stenocarpa]